MSSEITAEKIEDVFGKQSDSTRFANFCNAVIVAECSVAPPTLPMLSEKPGADGGIDSEWTIPTEHTSSFTSPFLSPGWNVFQYKARSIVGGGRDRAYTNLCSGLKGALKILLNRLTETKPCSRYTLFTNLQLGVETTARTQSSSLLNSQRNQLKMAITEGIVGSTHLEIIDAAQLAAIVNKHPALRLSYFTEPVAKSWNDAWETERKFKDYKVSVSLIGRNKELQEMCEWLKDSESKVIVLCGPSGMGKTRLALEATRAIALSTTVVDVVDELIRTDFSSLETLGTTCVIIVEDPTFEQAETLVKRALSCKRVKLILTVQTEAKAPMPKLTEHEAIKISAPLKPLDNQDAESLLKAAGATFDRQALDWILLQAGGNPEILLSAAELKDDLRAKSGDLKKQLHERFCRKIQNELGPDGVRALKVLSPVLYVKCYGENPELKLVCDSLGMQIQPLRILEVLPDLEKMGYIRRRGNYVSIVPPLFAARLVEELAGMADNVLRDLFTNLSKSNRDRFLERMVTVDLPERSTFWNFVFGENGPLETGYRTSGLLDHIDCLARAVPVRTARFLEAKLKTTSKVDWKAYGLVSTARELACETESCALGMHCLELLALKEIDESRQLEESHVFCECFVDWHHYFPMSYHDRLAWIERLLESENQMQRQLGAHVIAFVTSPPQSLSGYSVTVRRLGQTPVKRLWSDVFSYVNSLVQMRFELTQSNDEEVAKIARNKFDHCLSRLIGHVSPDQLVAIVEKFVDWSFNGKLNSDVRNVRSAIHWIERRFSDWSQKRTEHEVRQRLAAVLKRLAAIRERFDDGEFVLRLKVATGNHAFDTEWEETKYGRMYRHQKKLLTLALEAIESPQLMDQEAWTVIKDANSHLASEFLTFLGEYDSKRRYAAHFESEAVNWAGKWRFGLYCSGVFRSDPNYFDGYLERLAQDPTFDKGVLLFPIAFTNPTTGNRRRLFHLIENKAVHPMDVASLFTGGRWLDTLPVSEVRTVFEYMAQGEKWESAVADAVSLYLFPDKPLPMELFPLGERILNGINISLNQNDAYRCNQIAVGIAKADLKLGFKLLADRVAVLNSNDLHNLASGWNPFSNYSDHEFWDYLRSKTPEPAYRCFCTLKNDHDHFGDDHRFLLDLENHDLILLKIAKENDENAERIAFAMSFKQPRFIRFSFALLEGRELNCKVASCLESHFFEQVGWGTPLDKLQSTLNQIELELKVTELPAHGRLWLERLKLRTLEAIKTSYWNDGEHELLGW